MPAADLRRGGALAAASTYDAGAANQQAAAEQVFALANQARMQAGVGTLAVGSGVGGCGAEALPADGGGGSDCASLWRRAGPERQGGAGWRALQRD